MDIRDRVTTIICCTNQRDIEHDLQSPSKQRIAVELQMFKGLSKRKQYRHHVPGSLGLNILLATSERVDPVNPAIRRRPISSYVTGYFVIDGIRPTRRLYIHQNLSSYQSPPLEQPPLTAAKTAASSLEDTLQQAARCGSFTSRPHHWYHRLLIFFAELIDDGDIIS